MKGKYGWKAIVMAWCAFSCAKAAQIDPPVSVVEPANCNGEILTKTQIDDWHALTGDGPSDLTMHIDAEAWWNARIRCYPIAPTSVVVDVYAKGVARPIMSAKATLDPKGWNGGQRWVWTSGYAKELQRQEAENASALARLAQAQRDKDEIQRKKDLKDKRNQAIARSDELQRQFRTSHFLSIWTNGPDLVAIRSDSR